MPVSRLALMVALLMTLIAPSNAQVYPDRAVKIVNPYPAGGSVDITARILAQKLSDSMGQQLDRKSTRLNSSHT